MQYFVARLRFVRFVTEILLLNDDICDQTYRLMVSGHFAPTDISPRTFRPIIRTFRPGIRTFRPTNRDSSPRDFREF